MFRPKDPTPNNPQDGSDSGSVFVSISSIVLTDAQGNRITGVPYLPDSGTAYRQDDVLVPEPESGFLLIGDLLAVLA
jgi:hypothetical protein